MRVDMRHLVASAINGTAFSGPWGTFNDVVVEEPQ